MPLPQLLPVLLLAASLFASAQASGPRLPLTPEQIASAITSTAGVTIDPGDISLPASIVSSSARPILRVTHAEVAGTEGVRLRLSCATTGQCLPFVALLRTRTPEQASVMVAKFEPLSTRPLPTSRQGDLNLRAGAHATFLLESDHMRISIPVICIDSGAPGSEVRVASLDRKQLYRGIVSDNATVRGALP